MSPAIRQQPHERSWQSRIIAIAVRLRKQQKGGKGPYGVVVMFDEVYKIAGPSGAMRTRFERFYVMVSDVIGQPIRSMIKSAAGSIRAVIRIDKQ